MVTQRVLVDEEVAEDRAATDLGRALVVGDLRWCLDLVPQQHLHGRRV